MRNFASLDVFFRVHEHRREILFCWRGKWIIFPSHTRINVPEFLLLFSALWESDRRLKNGRSHQRQKRPFTTRPWKIAKLKKRFRASRIISSKVVTLHTESPERQLPIERALWVTAGISRIFPASFRTTGLGKRQRTTWNVNGIPLIHFQGKLALQVNRDLQRNRDFSLEMSTSNYSECISAAKAFNRHANKVKSIDSSFPLYSLISGTFRKGTRHIRSGLAIEFSISKPENSHLRIFHAGPVFLSLPSAIL